MIIRSKSGNCYKMYSSTAWGKYLVEAEDPDGAVLTDFDLNGIQLIDDFPVIPKELWTRIVALCFYMCPSNQEINISHHGSQLEVQVCLLRDTATLTKWKIVVPFQKVSGVSVSSDLERSIDIETGEEYTQFPPVGWTHAGSCHSHNTMSAFFSGTDDRSELGVPGLHIVIGRIDHRENTYTYKASIVMKKRRKVIEKLSDVADTTPIMLEFAEKVPNYINTVVYANRGLYSNIFKSKKDKSRGKTRTSFSSPFNPDWFSDHWSGIDDKNKVSLFDDDGKPDGFFHGLDHTNSDLFDNVDDATSLKNKVLTDSDMQGFIKDQMDSGEDVADILASLEQANKDMED